MAAIFIVYCTVLMCDLEIRTDFHNKHACMIGAQRALAAAGIEATSWTCVEGQRV